jgi:hypothetical protein
VAKTAEIANGFHGDKLYQQRARKALPILVRQAQAEEPISYLSLAQELGMPNARNLNFPLGCIGDALSELAKRRRSDIPHIQALVVNLQTRLPGPGFDEFLKQRGYTWNTPYERRAIIEEYWAKVYAYPHWPDVLKDLSVRPAPSDLTEIIDKAGHTGGGGESAEHLALKRYVARNPELVGLAAHEETGAEEYCLPSGDSIDVLFATTRRLLAVEVKPASSPKEDITRGLFQCVKYRSVLRARARFEHDRREIAARLVLGGTFPPQLIPLRNSLNVPVIDNVRVTRGRA